MHILILKWIVKNRQLNEKIYKQNIKYEFTSQVVLKAQLHASVAKPDLLCSFPAPRGRHKTCISLRHKHGHEQKHNGSEDGHNTQQ